MSDGMRRELAYLSLHATNRYFIPNWGSEILPEKLAESEEDLLEHRTDGSDAFDTLYIGCEKLPQADI